MRRIITLTHLYLTILAFALFTITASTAFAINVGSSLCQETISDIGEKYTNVIKILNSEKIPVEIKLYQTDFHFFSDGTNNYGEPGKTSRSNAQWIEQLPQRITIPPEQDSIVQFTVNVPSDPTLSGSYWSMIMVEKVNQEDLESISSGSRQLGVRQLIRYGVQVVTHIGDSGIRQLEFRGLKLIKGNDGRYLKINMENSGTRALRTNLWIDFYSEDGGYTKKINGVQRRIYPECSISQKLDIGEIPAGTYKAVVVADAGDETVFGTSFSIQFEE